MQSKGMIGRNDKKIVIDAIYSALGKSQKTFEEEIEDFEDRYEGFAEDENEEFDYESLDEANSDDGYDRLYTRINGKKLTAWFEKLIESSMSDSLVTPKVVVGNLVGGDVLAREHGKQALEEIKNALDKAKKTFESEITSKYRG